MSLSPVRDYVFVDDVVKAIAQACTVTLDRPVRRANVGSGRGVSVRQLCEGVQRVVGRHIPIEETGQRDRPQTLDVCELVADVSAAARWLGWRAETSLESGIQAILEDTQRELAA